jgi:hypothetical protein
MERAPIPCLSIVFYLGLTFESFKELGARQWHAFLWENLLSFLNPNFSPCPTFENPSTFMMASDSEVANSPQAYACPKLEVPSQNGINGLAHAYVESLAWVRNTPSHIGVSCHLLRS